MHRFYCESLPDTVLPDPVLLDREQSRHAGKVLRLEVGATIELFDGRGRIAQAMIENMANLHGQAAIRLHHIDRFDPPRPRIDIATAIPKGPKADEMVVQLSQLGGHTLIPLKTQRTVIDPRPAKLTRFGRMLIESAKQSLRPHVMAVAEPISLELLLEDRYDLKLIAHPGTPLIKGLAFELHRARTILVLIGPEGGFTEDELVTARAAGCKLWRLSPHILRIETAATAALSILNYLAQQA